MRIYLNQIMGNQKNLDGTLITGIEDDILEYDNLRYFYNRILKLKPKDVRDKGISERGLRNIELKIKQLKGLKNRSKIIGIFFNNT